MSDLVPLSVLILLRESDILIYEYDSLLRILILNVTLKNLSDPAHELGEELDVAIIAFPSPITHCFGMIFHESNVYRCVQGDTSGCEEPPVDFRQKRSGLAWSVLAWPG